MQSTYESGLLFEPLQKNKTLLWGESQLLNFMWNPHEYMDRLHTWKLYQYLNLSPTLECLWQFVTRCVLYITELFSKIMDQNYKLRDHSTWRAYAPVIFSHFTSFTNQQWICTPQNIKTPPMWCTNLIFDAKTSKIKPDIYPLPSPLLCHRY